MERLSCLQAQKIVFPINRKNHLGRATQNRKNIKSQPVDPDTLLANVAETYKHAVGIVVVGGIPGVVGGIPAGTAWAVGPNKFATNGHVVRMLETDLVELKKK